MSVLRRVALLVGGLLVLLALGAGVGWWWMDHAADARLSAKFETHRVDFPVPFPLGEAELAGLRVERAASLTNLAPAAGGISTPPVDPLVGLDLAALAAERAAARGKHLVESRYACIECHGKDFGGGTMIDDPAIGRILGPNLTAGSGSVTKSYDPSDWDRIVRHGVKPDGTPAVMPSEDFRKMSDQELSDIITYIRTAPPVDKVVPAIETGPVGTMLVATGQLLLTAEQIPDHHAAHLVEPPAEGVTVEFGAHLTQPCVGCHRADLSGGPVIGGDPSWPPAGNLTPGPDGLQGWTYDDFVLAMRAAKSKDGRALLPPMSAMTTYAANATDTELQAMWTYLQSLPPTADGT